MGTGRLRIDGKTNVAFSLSPYRESITRESRRAPSPCPPIPMPLRQRFIYPLAAVIATVFFGTVGYRALEGWSWFDGLYRP